MSMVQASVPCQLAFRHGVAILLEALLEDVAQRAIYQVISAFNEAFNNVVIHSSLSMNEQLTVRAERFTDRVELQIEDAGVAYHPDLAALNDDPDPLDLDAGGIGLLLIKKCMDEVRYERSDRNVLRLIKRVPAIEPITGDSEEET